MKVCNFVPLRGDGPDHAATTVSTLVDIRDGDGQLIKQVSLATASSIIKAGGKPLFNSRRQLVRVTVDLSRGADDASRTTVANLPATSGSAYPVRRLRTARHGQLAAGRRTDRNVQSNVRFHDRCEWWNVPLPRSENR